MPVPFSNSRIRLPQGQIFWREIGRHTTPVVFLHGSGRDGSQWIPVLERLGETHHCLALDLLGFGDSEYPIAHCSIQLLVESLASYADALHLEQVDLVGHSLGGWVAASYALQHPERVRRLVLFSPLGVEGTGKAPFQRWEKRLVSPFPLWVWVLRSLRPLAKLLGWKEKIDKLLTRREQLLKCPITCDLLLRRSDREIQGELLDNRLEFIQVPTLVIQGKEDESINLSRAQTYAALIPEAKLCLIPGEKGNLPETACDRAVFEIQQFLL
ncbi:MAG: alpha/beta hydrolase [Cyanobacteriota bacterium]|nr:alpha/beta hydrolase [Cyanobacteriota bacterium]